MVDKSSSRSTGTWPIDLIELIDKYSNRPIPKHVLQRKSLHLAHAELSDTDKKKIMLGQKLKEKAEECKRFCNTYYNKAWVPPQDLPSGYNELQFLEALRQAMVPIVLHKNALTNSGRYLKKDRAKHSAKCEMLYDKALKVINRRHFLPPGWLGFILGGVPRGERKGLVLLQMTEARVKDKNSFCSRAQRRSERMAGAQIGRAVQRDPVPGPAVIIDHVQEQPLQQQTILHEHILNMSIAMCEEDKKMKYMKQQMDVQDKMLNNYVKYGWDITKKEAYDVLKEKNFELLTEYNDFIEQYVKNVWNDNENTTITTNENTTNST